VSVLQSSNGIYDNNPNTKPCLFDEAFVYVFHRWSLSEIANFYSNISFSEE